MMNKWHYFVILNFSVAILFLTLYVGISSFVNAHTASTLAKSEPGYCNPPRLDGQIHERRHGRLRYAPLYLSFPLL